MISDKRIFELAEPFGEFRFGDAQGDKRIGFARVVEAEAQSNARAHYLALKANKEMLTAETARADKAEKQRDELLAALKHYGTHLPDCDWLRKVEESDQSGELPNECSCGLANVKGGV